MANRITTLFDFQERGQGLKKIRADVAATEGSINKAKTGIKGLWAEFSGSRAAQAAVAGLAVKIGKDAVVAASDLEESINAVNVTYGESADEVHKLGETSAESFGLSQRAFNEAAVMFSSFADTVAGEGGDVAGVVEDITQRAADFASVHNIDVAEAMRVFQSALAGEQEPIKRYGKNLSAAAVEAYALENGLAASKAEITESIKQQARYGLLMRETADTAGDFKNTQDGLANSTKTLSAQFEDMQATLGRQLLPMVSDTTATLVDMAHVAGQLGDQLEALGNKVPDGPIGEFVKLMGPLGLVESTVKKPLEGLSWALDKIGVSSEKSTFSLDKAKQQYYANKYAAGQYAGAVEEAGEATEESGDAIEESMSDAADIIASQIRGAEAEFDRYGSSVEKWAADNEAAAEAAAEAQEEFRSRVEEAMSGATSSVFSFSDETLEDVDAWQQSMLEKTWELGKWQNNLLEIAGKTSTDFATYLASMGEAGMGLVDELANSEDELEESFDIWKGTTEVAGRDMAALFEQIGADSAAGLAAGLKANWFQVDSALARLTHSTVEGMKGDLDIRSPSEVFAKEIGEPIAQGIAEGIERDGHKIADELRDQIEDARDEAVDAAEELVDATQDALDGLFDEHDSKEKAEDLNRQLRDAFADVAEEEAKRGTDAFDPVKLSDAQESVRDTAMKLFEEQIRDPNRIFGRTSNKNLYQLGNTAGLSKAEVDEFIAAAVTAQNARTTLATTTATADGTSAALIAKIDELVRVIGGSPDATRLSGGYTINLNGFANEQSIQMLIDAINEVRRREAGAA